MELLGDSWWAGVEKQIIGNVSSLAVLITFLFFCSFLQQHFFLKLVQHIFLFFFVQYAVAFSSFAESFTSFDQPQVKGPDRCNLNPSQYCQQFFSGAFGEFILVW